MKYYRLLPTYKLKLNKNQAFTLVELTIVIIIITIITALCIPTLLYHNRNYIAAEAEALRSTLWYLQQQARAQNKQITLTFNETESLYTTDIETHKLSRQVKFGIMPGILGPPSDPKKPVKKAITFPDKKIVVHPHGTIKAGTAYLIDERQNLLYAITVPIAGVSYIRLYQYRNNQWHVYK